MSHPRTKPRRGTKATPQTAIAPTAPAPLDDPITEDEQALADMVEDAVAGDSGIRHGSCVKPEKALAVLILRQQGVPIRKVEQILGIDHRTIKGIELRAEHGEPLAKLLLKSGALEHVKEWQQASKVAAAKGRHEPARDALVAAGVIELKPDSKPQVNIGIVLNGGDGPTELHLPQQAIK